MFQHRRFPTCKLAFAALAFAASSLPHITKADVDPSIQRRNDRAAYLLHLIDEQRYAEAAQGVQQLFIDYPTDAGSYELRAVLQMHVGAFQQAQRDFEYAQGSADAADPVPSYGLALCALNNRDTDTASKMLGTAQALATPAERDDVTIAQAILAASNGDNAEAIRLASIVTSPTATEIIALASYSDSPAKGVPLIEQFLTNARINGIPRVNEDAGLRYVGLGGKDGVIEPSLTESVLQAMFAQRLQYQNVPAAPGGDNVVMGTVAVSPPDNVSAQAGTSDLVVTVSVDDHLLGMINSLPFEMAWDTRKVDNGTHLVKFEVSDSHGAILQTLFRKYKVANPGADLNQVSVPFPADIQAGLWSELSIHPAYKAAEYTLAQAYLARKDRQGAVDHLLIAAALDSEYRDVGDMVPQAVNGSSHEGFQLATTSLFAPSKMPSSRIGEMWSGSKTLKEVALTFDDGPSPVETPPLLDALHAAHVPGTFFVVGIRASAAPDIIQRMVADGHEVENHTYTHPNLDQAIPQHILEEYLRNAVVIKTLTGRWPRFLRPPGGNSNPQVMEIAHQCGMIGGFWTIDALGAEDTGSSPAVRDFVVNKAHGGAIILMHNGTPATTGAIAQMVAGLKAKGLKCVTLSQLARDSGISLP